MINRHRKQLLQILFGFLLLVIRIETEAQVLINLQLPQAGVTLKTQLWNLSVTNTGPDEPDVQVEMMLSDVTTNQPILSASSKVFRLTKGARLLQVAELSPIIYNVLSSSYNVDVNPNGFLPIGTFSVCYRVVKLVSDQTEQLAEECETIDVEPVSPPMLQLPFDEEVVESKRPYFAWIPPLPQQLFHNLLYDVVLVEVLPIQSSSEAIQQNLPIYRGSNLPEIGLQYPAALAELDTTKLYAWQVTAKGGFNAIAKSEIWTFRIQSSLADTSAVLRKGHFYATLKRDVDVAYVVCKGVLRFEYVNEGNDSTISYSISDLNTVGRAVLALPSNDLTVTFGQNFIELDLHGVNGLKQGHVYLLEVASTRRDRRFLKFEYKKAD